MSGFAPGCPACGALPAHPCRRSKQACPRMLQMPLVPKTCSPADLDRIASRMAIPGAPLPGAAVVRATPQHPAFAYPCPECESEPYASCRAPNGDYLGHKSIHEARTRVGAPVADDGEPVFRAHNHLTPAQDIARLAYWIPFWEATGAQVPSACKAEVAAAVARWPLESKR